MTAQQEQQIVDLVMSRMALRHGSSRRRDFEVACLTVEAINKHIQGTEIGLPVFSYTPKGDDQP